MISAFGVDHGVISKAAPLVRSATGGVQLLGRAPRALKRLGPRARLADRLGAANAKGIVQRRFV